MASERERLAQALIRARKRWLNDTEGHPFSEEAWGLWLADAALAHFAPTVDAMAEVLRDAMAEVRCVPNRPPAEVERAYLFLARAVLLAIAPALAQAREALEAWDGVRDWPICGAPCQHSECAAARALRALASFPAVAPRGAEATRCP